MAAIASAGITSLPLIPAIALSRRRGLALQLLQRRRVGVGREADRDALGVRSDDRHLRDVAAEGQEPPSFLSNVTDSAASR